MVRPPRGKNYYLSMRGKNEQWLKYKMGWMPDFFSNAVVHKYNNTFRCNSSCSVTLTDLKEYLYDGNQRKVTESVLDSLRDVALLVWFLDGGSKTGRGKKNAYLNTTKIGMAGTKLALNYFEIVQMPCNLNRDGDRLKVLFSVDGTVKFLKTFAYLCPQFMYHRL